MSRERIYLRVIRGGMVPADDLAWEQLRRRGYKTGDLLYADLAKNRNPGFHRLVHRIGQLVVANIEDFASMSAHDAIKQIQAEAGIACTRQMVDMPGVGKCLVTAPKSLAYDSMDEGEFRETARAMCRHIAETYWPSLTPERIEQMAESFVEE